MDWPKISLAHQSIQGYRKFVANTGFAEENQVTKSRPNEILQPLLRLIKLSVRRCGATNYTILMSSQSSVHFMRKMSVLHTALFADLDEVFPHGAVVGVQGRRPGELHRAGGEAHHQRLARGARNI